MSHADASPDKLPRALLDANRARPGLWRWMAFWTLVLVVVSLWVPLVPSQPGAPAAPAAPERASQPLTAANVGLLLTAVVLAVLVVPASPRIRMVIAALLLGSTVLAWALEAPFRRLLGPPFDTPPSSVRQSTPGIPR